MSEHRQYMYDPIVKGMTEASMCIKKITVDMMFWSTSVEQRQMSAYTIWRQGV